MATPAPASGPSREAAGRPRRETRGRGGGAVVLAAALLAPAGCASSRLPPPAVAEAARTAPSYAARLRVSLRGPGVRGRADALIGFRRPDALRLEVPGPAGARLLAVASAGVLTAVFPSERAWTRGPATAEGVEALLGVGLSPAELMDLLVGVRPPRLVSYEARWGGALPRSLSASLPDGTRLTARVEDAEAGPPLRPEAFAEPRHEGYRRVDLAEARDLWMRP